MLHPLLKQKTTISIFAATWIFVMFIHFISEYFISKYPFTFSLADAFLSAFVYFLLSLGLWFAISFGMKREQQMFQHIGSNIVLYSFITAFWIGLVWMLMFILDVNWTFLFRETLPFRIIISVFLYLSTVLIYHTVNYSESLRQKESNELELKSLVREAQLNELRSQLHPHFLFNSLNSINSLTITNPAKAGEMLIKLSEFLRYSLNQKKHRLTTLSEELYHVGLYLDIEKVRFGSRLEYIQDICEECLSCQIPLMLLQPLMENAVKHGVYNSDVPVTIHLKCTVSKGFLKILLTNNYTDEPGDFRGTGTGLHNVKERLRLVYGTSENVKTDKENGIFTIEIHVPQTHEQVL